MVGGEGMGGGTEYCSVLDDRGKILATDSGGSWLRAMEEPAARREREGEEERGRGKGQREGERWGDTSMVRGFAQIRVGTQSMI